MPIPLVDEQGFLPIGIHECSLAEIKTRFGSFQGSDRRPELFDKLIGYLSEAKISGVVISVVIDGSFATSKPDPNDIDLVLELKGDHNFAADLSPVEYNVVSKRHVHRRYGFDLLVARSGSAEYERWTEFFQQVRLEPGRRKGILRVRI
jgi:hypothetical protein